MKLPRRNFLHLGVAAALQAVSRIAWAQSYFAKIERMITFRLARTHPARATLNQR